MNRASVHSLINSRQPVRYNRPILKRERRSGVVGFLLFWLYLLLFCQSEVNENKIVIYFLLYYFVYEVSVQVNNYKQKMNIDMYELVAVSMCVPVNFFRA